MKKLKEFIKNKKVNRQFKGLGEGYTLNSSSPSTNVVSNTSQGSSSKPVANSQEAEERRARMAEAVERRLNSGKTGMTAAQKKIQMQVRRELEKEEEERKLKEFDEQKFSSVSQPKVEKASEEEDNMLYICDLIEGLALKRSEMYEAMEQFLRAQLEEEPVDASVLILHSLNPADKVHAAKGCLQVYIKNILAESNNPKPVKGAIEFLFAIGFKETKDLNETNNEVEDFLVLSNLNLSLIQEASNELEEGAPIYLRVFLIDPTKPIPSPEIAPEFFTLSVAEVKALQKAKTEEIERMTTLRTRKMREADEKNSPKTEYKYTLVRIRFPNNYVLQGIFNVHESIMAVREFVEKNLKDMLGTFTLTLPYSASTRLDDEKTLLDYSLVPSVLMHFQWGEDVLVQCESTNLPMTYLTEFNEQNYELLN